MHHPSEKCGLLRFHLCHLIIRHMGGSRWSQRAKASIWSIRALSRLRFSCFSPMLFCLLRFFIFSQAGPGTKEVFPGAPGAGMRPDPHAGLVHPSYRIVHDELLPAGLTCPDRRIIRHAHYSTSCSNQSSHVSGGMPIFRSMI